MDGTGSEQAGICGWYEDVVSDLAQAFRRDGFSRSAELLDDVRLVLAQEQAAMAKTRAEATRPKAPSLKIVAD